MSSSETQRALPPRKNSSPLTTVVGSTASTSIDTSNQDGNSPHQAGDNSASATLSRTTSPLETLLSMGFARNRAEKALAATGHRGVRIASDWLLAHVNDPLLDVATPRHYFLYLCPVQGCPLARQLQTFWDASQTQIGWNGAHNCPAHVTLVSGSGMVIPDTQVPQLISAIKKVADDFSRDLAVLCSSKGNGISLEKYVSPNYLGLFVGKNEEILLGSFIGALSAELSSLGIPTSGLDGTPKGGSSSPDSSITTSSGRQSFHMSLAYQFSSKHYAGLQDLAESLDITSPVDWELRLYSCDAKLAPKEIDVYRVSYAHVPREEDELELMAGDLVYINKDEARMASDPESTHSDGWVVGTSWLTGSTGFLPKNYVERTAQVNACTLHLTLPLNGQESLNKNGSSNLTGSNFLELRGAPEKQSLLSLSSASSLEERLRETATLLPPPPQQSQEEFPSTPHEVSNLDQTSSAQQELFKEESYDENDLKPTNTSSDTCPKQGNQTTVENYGPRQIYVVRHGERVDFTFGTWIPYSFDIKTHAYTRKDLNMPLKENIPLRAGGPEMFAKDCPLTRMGCIQAQLTGEAMRDNGVSISHVYVSPSLRCIQTAHHILKGLGKLELKMHIEPGLFEWLAWYQDAMPNWMSVPDLVKAGYNIDENYEPYISADELQDAQAQLQQPESVEQYYTRNFFVTRCILQATEPGKKGAIGGGNLLFVAHAASLDACSRQVVGKEPRSLSQMMAIVREVAYCGVALMEEEEDEEDTKSLMSSVADGMSVKSFKKKRLWKLKETPFPPLTHCSNSRFDSKILME